MEVQVFNSWDEAMVAMERATRTADLHVRAWQERIAVGDLILTAAEGEPVFSEVLEKYDEPRMRHYRFCRAHSIFVPDDDGELGDIHVCTVVAVLSRQQFEEAKANGWQFPSEDRGGAA